MLKVDAPTLSCTLNFVRCVLKIFLISARVAFRVGILTPLVARDAMSTISLNFGCSRARIGCRFVAFKLVSNSTLRLTYLPDQLQLTTRLRFAGKPYRYKGQLALVFFSPLDRHPEYESPFRRPSCASSCHQVALTGSPHFWPSCGIWP